MVINPIEIAFQFQLTGLAPILLSVWLYSSSNPFSIADLR
jgi:hypothetical protein